MSLLSLFNPYIANILCSENSVCFLCLLCVFKCISHSISCDQTAPL